jgi:membrane protein
MYGNLATLIMLMLWLYICMNLMLYGAEINAYFEKEFRQVRESMRDMMSHEKESEEK